MKLKPRTLARLMPLWPPFLGAGVRIKEIAEDGSRVVVTYKPTRITCNAVGTAFGGTMLSMIDPFYMLVSLYQLGEGYYIWDVGVEATFVKPGRSRVSAEIAIDPATVELIKEKTADGSKYLHWFEVDLIDEEGDVVAHMRRQVYYRKKRH
ncbi:PaaI family thioesterase [Corynebacterium mastitidis]